MSTTETIFHSDPETMSGTPVFVGTRVPVKNLFDHLAHGKGLEAFSDDFPSVSNDQMVAALSLAQEMLAAHTYSHRRMLAKGAVAASEGA